MVKLGPEDKRIGVICKDIFAFVVGKISLSKVERMITV